MNRKQSFLLLLLIVMVSSLKGQVPGMRKYTQLDGYDAAAGYRVNQDQKGYLWIGTDNGGIRFDGKYFSGLQSLHHSPNAEILECIPFTHQQIAMVPLSGRFFFLNHDTVIHFNKDPANQTENARWLNQYHHDVLNGAGWVWDAYDSAVNCLRKFTATELQKICTLPAGIFPCYAINDYIISSHLYKSYCSYDYRSQKLQILYHEDYTPVDYTKEWFIALHRSAGVILTSDLKKNICVYRWHPGDSILKKINSLNTPTSMPVFSSYSAQGKQYLLTWDAATPKDIFYYPDVCAPQVASQMLKLSIPGIMPNNCFVDNHNNLWITSTNNALYFLSANHIRNAVAVQHLDLAEALPKCIAGTGNQLFIGYVAGKKLTLLSGTKAVHLPLNDMFGEGCRNILVVNDSTLIVYNRDAALVHTRKGKIEYLKLYDEPFKDFCLYDQGFLAASGGGLWHVVKNRNGDYQKKKIFEYRAVAVEVLAGTILIGTPTGLYRKAELREEAVKLSAPLVQDADITDITLLDSSRALISTNGRGILVYHTDGTISSLNERKGIPQYIRQLYRQDSRTYWAVTNSGVHRINFTADRQITSVKNYTFYDGLPSNNVTGICVRSDTAYVTTTEGLGVIPLKDSSSLAIPVPVVYINSVQAGDSSYREPEQVLQLLHHQDDLRLQLSGISYESLGNVRYYYKLVPYQKDWIATPEPDIRFSHVPPGDYTFEVFVTNAAGGKSTITRLGIAIKPAFWQTIYFKIAVIAFFMALIAAFVIWQLKRVEQKRSRDMQQKKHLAELELEAIKAQINPHFIYNCLNSIQYLNYKAEYEQAQQYLNIFSRLIRKTMQYAQKVFISIDEEVEYLSNYLQMEQLRFKDKLKYTLTVDEVINKNTTVPAMLLQPYVENALKHGVAKMANGGSIDISFKKRNELLEIEIRDNGPGFSSLQKQGSLGLRLSGTRAVSYNELFNIHVTVACYNEQDIVPEKTGAIVKIIISTTKNGTDNPQSSHHR